MVIHAHSYDALGTNCEAVFVYYPQAGPWACCGLAISFVSTDQDQEVLKEIEKRFEVALPYVASLLFSQLSQ